MSNIDDSNNSQETRFAAFKDLPLDLQEALIKEQVKSLDGKALYEIAKEKLEQLNAKYHYWKDEEGWHTT